MRLVVGLGNPGNEYDGTRHNIGFEVAEELARRGGIRMGEKKFKAVLGKGTLAGESVVIMEPQTYMNLSGESVGPAAGFFKVAPEEIVVIHDDLDIECGRMKLKQGGGHGGHNGLRSLVRHLPSAEFVRVRVGIGRPPPRWDAADYVLSRFTGGERPAMDDAVTEAADAVEAIFRDGIRRAMNEFNRTDGGRQGAVNGSAAKE
jgi:PTH1 family peptidyl-tRNA hydrolase